MSETAKKPYIIPLDPPVVPHATTLEEKKANWETIATYFSTVTDKKGKKVDAGIKDVVIALNVLGFQTSQSCEGHTERGFAHPWVSLLLPHDDVLENKRKILFEKISTVKAEGKKDEVTKLLKEHSEVSIELWKPRLAMVHQVLMLIKEFYEDRQVPHDRILNIGTQFGRLHSQGGIVQEIADEAVKRQKLLEYQKEMHEFAEFLKEKYFSL